MVYIPFSLHFLCYMLWGISVPMMHELYNIIVVIFFITYTSKKYIIAYYMVYKRQETLNYRSYTSHVEEKSTQNLDYM